MSYDIRRGSEDSAQSIARGGVAGRRTLTMSLEARPSGAVVQQRSDANAPDPAVQMARDVQLRELCEAAVRPDLHAAPPIDPLALADHGVSGSGGALPHLDAIQRSFGRHDVSGISAHGDDRARSAAQAMGAEAFATGTSVAFAGTPSLHTAAHEAAHVVQQRAGVHLKGGVGAAGDAYERHADAVADAVVAGHSAELLLDELPRDGGGGARTSGAAVQRKEIPVWGGTFEDKIYQADDGVASKGATMLLHFKPRPDLGNEGDSISLVQTVKDTTRLTAQGQDHTPHAQTSQVDNRKLTLGGNDNVQPDEVGVAIDQEVVSDPNEGPSRLVNKDPRYSERRMDGGAPLKLLPDQHTGAPVSTVKDRDGWKVAVLSDQPALNTDVIIAQQGKVPGTVTGDMKFEVVAMQNGTDLLGSVRWGWSMNGGHAVLDPAQLTLGDHGHASPTFLKAARKWNETQLHDPSTGQNHDPMQLPTVATPHPVKAKSSAPRWILEDAGSGYVRVGLNPNEKLKLEDISSEEQQIQLTFDDESDEKDGGTGGPYLGMVFSPDKVEKAKQLLAKLLGV